MTGYTDTYWIAQYDIIETGNCGAEYIVISETKPTSSTDCKQKCDNDPTCIVYGSKNNDFCTAYSECNIVQNYKEGTQWGGTFYRKIKSKSPGYFYQTDPYDAATNSGPYNQAKECINLNDPTNEETNKIPNVVSRK